MSRLGLALLALAAIGAAWIVALSAALYGADGRLDRLEHARRISACALVIFEDYSTRTATPAELRACLRRADIRLRFEGTP